LTPVEITFLGTGASNAYPEAFCSCRHCRRARELGGPSLRKRSALLVNDDLLIDLGPDTSTAAAQHGRPLTRVRYCLQTHSHTDHLDPSQLLSRSPEFGVVGAQRLHFYGSRATLQTASAMFQAFFDEHSLFDPGMDQRLSLRLHEVQAFVPFQAGKYRVTPVAARHSPRSGPLLYSVEVHGRALFYGTDTGPLPDDTWDALCRQQPRFDLVVLDHTAGLSQVDDNHMNSEQFQATVARMQAEGLLAAGARAFATHISHDANPPHPDLAAHAASHGYEVAYDGLNIGLPS
jgi:phosphoribosyl 1,2-cyclic phosphate phosphodiesterase